MTKTATFEPEQGLSHVRGLRLIMGDDDWRERGDQPDWVAMENETGETVYIFARHILHLTTRHEAKLDPSPNAGVPNADD